MSTNIPEIISRSIPKIIWRIRVLPLESTLISSPPSTRGIAQIAIIAYERYIFVFASSVIPKREFSNVRFCILNAAIPVSMSMIPSTIFAVLTCASVGRFIMSPRSFIIILFLKNYFASHSIQKTKKTSK